MRHATLCATLTPVFLTVLFSWPLMTWAADAAGLFQVVIGNVKLIGKDGRARAAVKGGNVYEGDRIVTGERSLAQVKYTDGGLMSIRANTEFVLNKFSYAGPHDEKPSIFMSLIRGGLRSITGLIGRTNRNGYRISTSTATIGIRGTDHEPRVILPPPPGMKAIDLPGTYDKVNKGRTFLQTPKGVVEILSQQVGFAPSANVAPKLLPKIPDFYREEPKKQNTVGSAVKQDDQTANKSGDGADQDGKSAQKLLTRPTVRELATEAVDKSGDGTDQDAKSTTTVRPSLSPAVRGLATDSAASASTTEKALVDPAISTISKDSSLLLSPTTTINKDSTLLSPTTSTITKDSSLLLSPTTTTISPATSTITRDSSLLLSPTTTTISPTTTTSPTTAKQLTSPLLSPTTSTITKDSSLLLSPTTTTISPTTTTSPTTTKQLTSPLLSPSTTLIKK